MMTEIQRENTFPPEIWRVILNKIDDPLILMKIQFVSWDFYEPIKPMLRETTIWKNACRKHVPNFWIELNLYKLKLIEQNSDYFFTPKKENATLADVTLKFWKYTLLTWTTYLTDAQLPIAPSATECVASVSAVERISCIDVLDDIAVVGSTEGVIYFYHIRDWSKPFFIGHQETCVTDVKLGMQFACCLIENRRRNVRFAVSTSVDGELKYWDYTNKVELEFEQTLGKYIFIPEKTTKSFPEVMSAYENKLTHLIANSCTALKVWWAVMMRLMKDDEIVAIHRTEQRTTMMTFDGMTTKMSFLVRRDSRNTMNSYFVDKDRPLLLPEDLASAHPKFLLISSDIAVCYTDRFVGFCIRNQPWFSHNMAERLYGSIATIYVFKGQILMVGMETGLLHLFEVDLRDPANIRLPTNNPVETVIAANEALISIRVGVLQNSGDSDQQYCVYAATEKNCRPIKTELIQKIKVEGSFR